MKPIEQSTIIRDIKTAMDGYHQICARQPKPDRIADPVAWRGRLREERYRGNILWEAKQQAAHAFGRLNGWWTNGSNPKDKRATVQHFGVEHIGKHSFHDNAYGRYPEFNSAMFDHCIWYRANGRCAAIVAQPYDYANGGRVNDGHEKDDLARKIAAEHGAAVHIPPHPLASFWFPNRCRLYVFTAPDHRIVWLPEQINGIAAMKKEEVSAP